VSPRQKRIRTTALGLHLFLVVVISLQDVSSTLIGAGHYPPWFERALARTEAIASGIRGQGLSESNPLRQSLATYANCSGIEVGYSYFAPVIPGNCKLVFELHYPDGRVEYDLPVVGGSAAGGRVSALLDYLQVIHYLPLREALLRSLAESVRREHPDATLIRAVLGVANLVNADEYRAGKRISYRALFAYDFRFHPKTRPPVLP